MGGNRGLACALLLAATLLPGAGAEPAATVQPPNLVLVMTDDQTVESMRFLPQTRRLLGRAGTTYTNSVVSYPLCCPSRATSLTGRYAHNHGVYDNTDGFGALGDRALLPQRLQDAGYRTIQVGKYLNGYGPEDPIPSGWTSWHALTDPGTYAMYGYTLNRNGVVRTIGSPDVEDPRTYQTDVLARIARTEIRASAGAPFFLQLAFLAPHRENEWAGASTERNPRPAPRHRGALVGERAPRTPAYDETDVADKPELVRARTPLTQGERLYVDRIYRARARSLLAVDDAVASLVATLEAQGVLENTVIVFTSDNGYLHGEHRVRHGKFLPYEPSIRVPLIIRGPGFEAGVRSERPVANIDLAPTLLRAAGLDAHADLDGEPLQDPAPAGERIVLLETMRTSDVASDLLARLDLEDPAVLPYQAIRSSRFVFIRYASGEQELYDLAADPWQLENRVTHPSYVILARWLETRMEALATCAGSQCRDLGRADTALDSLLRPG